MRSVVVRGVGARRLREGYGFVYNKWLSFPEGEPGVGEYVRLVGVDGELLGCGIFESVGPVGVRVLSFKECFYSLEEAVYERIVRAFRVREKLGYVDEGAYRLVNSDGDLFSGLIVDVYNDVVVVQSSSQAVDAIMPVIVDTLASILGGGISVYEKSVQRSRRDIGLGFVEKFHRGSKVETVISEGNSKFIVNVVEGQKTGFFLDQRDNRVKLEKYVKGGEKVLDLFSYTGGFGIHAANSGAKHVVFVEEDPNAIAILRRNVKLNKLSSYEIYEGNVWSFLNKAIDKGEKYDIVIVDPPAFIQSREGFRRGYEAYRRLFQQAASLVAEEGILFLSSCSFFLQRERFLKLIHETMLKRYDYAIVDVGRVSGDHVLRHIDKHLDYLKTAYVYVRKRE